MVSLRKPAWPGSGTGGSGRRTAGTRIAPFIAPCTARLLPASATAAGRTAAVPAAAAILPSPGPWAARFAQREQDRHASS
jgi:hypothetical protein